MALASPPPIDGLGQRLVEASRRPPSDFPLEPSDIGDDARRIARRHGPRAETNEIGTPDLLADVAHDLLHANAGARPDIDGALLTGDPMALASALRKIDTATSAQPLRPHGTLAAASHLMIAHPFRPDGIGGMLSTHPPTSERVRRLEALSGGPRLAGG